MVDEETLRIMEEYGLEEDDPPSLKVPAWRRARL